MIEMLLQADIALLKWIHASWHNDVLDWLMPLLREKWVWLPLYVFLLGFVTINFRGRGWLWVLFFLFSIMVSDTTSSRLVKYQVKRPRPCQTEHVVQDLNVLVRCGSGYSFTSSHASNHFAIAAFIFFTLGRVFRRIRWPLMIWAGSVALAQVYVGLHYPLDVIGGGLLGILTGWGIAWYYNYRLGPWSIGRHATVAGPEQAGRR